MDLAWAETHFYIKNDKLFWKKPTSKAVRKDSQAGGVHSEGYRRVCFLGKYVYVHKIIWLFHTGQWIEPPYFIDHINGDRTDNNINNLRQVIKRQNQQNQKCHRDGHVLGTTKTRGGRFMARVRISGKLIYLGTFDTVLEAHEAYMKAANSIETPPT